jgi:hypothetical protein
MITKAVTDTHYFQDNINMDPREIGCEDVNWFWIGLYVTIS